MAQFDVSHMNFLNYIKFNNDKIFPEYKYFNIYRSSVYTKLLIYNI